MIPRSVVGCVLALACGGGGGGAPTDNDQSSLNNCVPPGSMGNENGVGKYCSKGGLQCNLFSFAKFCTVDFQSDAPGFCTNQCSADSDCGSGAVCTGDGSGKLGCVPVACVPKPDAGTPSDQDSSADGGTSAACASLSDCCALPDFPATSLSSCQSSAATDSKVWCEVVLDTYQLEGKCPSSP